MSGAAELVSLTDVHFGVSTTASCSSVFVETNGIDCFYPSEGGQCDGNCLDVDSSECSIDRDPPVVSCDIDCRALPTVDRCSQTLFELRCNMCLEAVALSFGAPLRQPPFSYELCPNTEYRVENEVTDTIFPVLDGSNILCGPDGSRSNNCTISGGSLQVEIAQTPRRETNMVSPIPLETVYMRGLTFSRGKFNPRQIYSPSVWARGSEGLTVVFDDCTWTVSRQLDNVVASLSFPHSIVGGWGFNPPDSESEQQCLGGRTCHGCAHSRQFLFPPGR